MGIQILNKDVSVISSVMVTPKSSIGSIFGTTGWASGGGFAPGDFNFANGNTNYTTNTVTFTKSGRLYIQGYPNAGEITAQGYLNGQLMYFYATSASALTNPNSFNDSQGGFGIILYSGNYGVFDVSIGNTMYFNCTGTAYPFGDNASISFRITSFTGTLIDDFTITLVGGCYLTSATVQYKGLLDDGPELTAMRTLREHYRGDVYYDDLIAEYYESSVAIIQGIDSSVNPSIDYEFIYQSVLKVKDYVDQSMWVEGWNEYYNSYLTLKNKYITNV
jgi:hypothetical protein